MKSISRVHLFVVIAVILAGSFSAATYAQDSTNAASTNAVQHVNSAVVPGLSPRFRKKHEDNVKIAKKDDINVLFMGDSITDFWRNSGGNRTNGLPGGAKGAFTGKPVFDKYFGSMKVANFGIAGDTTQGVLYRLQDGEGQGYQPRAIMLMIGTNNTGRNSAEEIAEGVAAVVRDLRKDFPKAKILLLGIFPRSTASSALRTKVIQVNNIICGLDDGQHVFYLDFGSKFLAADGSIPKDIMSDGLHPTTQGYEIWAETVKGPLDNMAKGNNPW
jgi:lysophospholipase L1-like esterase